MKTNISAEILQTEEIAPGIYEVQVSAPEICRTAVPGQLLHIKASENMGLILRRPISIAGADRESGTLEFLIRVQGEGTRFLASRRRGDKLDLLGPLGKGFSMGEQYKNVVLIGGGIGCFPLLFLAKELKHAKIHTFLGFKTKNEVVLEEDFSRLSSQITIATDDGTYGYSGLVTKPLDENLALSKPDIIYACGPKPMLKAVKGIAAKMNIPCQISLEEKMACGVGACLGCACKIKSDSGEWEYKHVCKDGPVFWADEVIFNE